MKETVVSRHEYDKRLIRTVIWSMLILFSYGIYWVLEPALMASTAAAQLEDTIVTYSIIQRFLYKGGVDKAFAVVWLLGMIIMWVPFLFGSRKEEERNEG